MRIRTKISLLVTALMTVVVGGILGNLIWVEQARVRADSSARVDALMDGVMRIGREAVNSGDELMLLSYVKFLMKQYSEIELAMISLPGHSSVLGEIKSELFYRTVTISKTNTAAYKISSKLPEAALTPTGNGWRPTLPADTLAIQLGFSKTALNRQIRQAQWALAGKLLAIAALGLILGIGGSLWVARLLAEPIRNLAKAAESFGAGNLQTTVQVSGRDELSDLGRQFNNMASRIGELIRFKEELMSTLTHELNTPLGGLKGFLEFIQESEETQSAEERQEAYRTMLEAVGQMELSLGNALHLFRTGNSPELKLEPLRLNDMVGEVLRLFGPTAQSNGISLKGPLVAGPVLVTADREMLRRVVVNLVTNALKYTPPGGQVMVAYEERGDSVHLSVHDTGPGISPRDRERIFTRFYRAMGPDGKPQRVPGTGLGLAIAKQAVELHKGKIWVDSQVGKGSVFHVTIPKAKDKQPAELGAA